MKSVHLYLYFDGNTEEAFQYYQSVFGGSLGTVTRYGDLKGMGSLSEAEQQKIAHIALPLTEHFSLHGSDASQAIGQSDVSGRNCYVQVFAESREEAERLFRQLAQGGEVYRAMQDMPWGGYYGSLMDKFGIQWMVQVA